MRGGINEIKELELAELVSRSACKGTEQLMCACDSHNYYFIKELLHLAAALWHCCEKPGTAPERGGEVTGEWVQRWQEESDEDKGGDGWRGG